MAIVKPDLTQQWASDGDKIAPSGAKIQAGWGPEIPPYQWENFIQNRQDEMLAYLNERGVPEWDNRTNYVGGGKSYVQGSDGVVYKSVATSGPDTSVQDPIIDTVSVYWVEAFASADDSRITGAIQTAGTGLTKSGTELSVNFGTTAGTAAQGNDPRLSGANQYGYIGGLELSNNTSVPGTDIDIAPGAARSANNTEGLLLSATLTKRLQSAGGWASGQGGNGLFSGIRTADTWYHVFLIRRDTDGVIDAGFDTSVAASNRPAGYTAFRRIGSIKTDASNNIIPFLNVGREFLWKSPIKDVLATLGQTSTTYTISAPLGVRVLASIFAVVGNQFGLYVRPTDAADVALASAPAPASFTAGVGFATNSEIDTGSFWQQVLTDSSAQVSARCGNSQQIAIVSIGWREL